MADEPESIEMAAKGDAMPPSMLSRGEVWAQIVMHQPPCPPLGVLHLPALPPIGSLIQIAMHGGLNDGRVEWVHFTPYAASHTVAVGISFGRSLPIQPQGADTADDLQKRMEKALEWQARAHEKLLAYTNVITLAGYAGIFAIWGFVKDKIGTKITLWTGLLLAVSLLIYVVYELYCMVQRTSAMYKRAKHAADSPADFMKAMAGIEKDEQKIALRSNRV